MTDPTGGIEHEIGRAVATLDRLGRRYALVGGLAVSIRGEVRFTHDVDLAVSAASDAEAERLAADVAAAGYEIAALVEHETVRRLSTVRLRSRARIHLDLLVASSGIEPEIVRAATPVQIDGVGEVRVATAEDLLAIKVLSMSDRRPQDRIDARGLLLANPELGLAHVRARLRSIRDRGFARDQDLDAKLQGLLRDVRGE